MTDCFDIFLAKVGHVANVPEKDSNASGICSVFHSLFCENPLGMVVPFRIV